MRWRQTATLHEGACWRPGWWRVSVVGPPLVGRYTLMQTLCPPRLERDRAWRLAWGASLCVEVDGYSLEVWRCHSIQGAAWWELPVVPGTPEYADVEHFADSNGVLFLLDSQRDRHEGNAAALDLVRGGFAQFGRSVEDVPVVFLMNKRDLPGIASEEELRAAFRTERCAHVASVAPRGEGVAEALRALVAMMAT